MTDIVSPETRSRMMAGIRSKNTKPEISIRKALFARGFRYKLHENKLPGKPDLLFPRYHAAVFIHGCFWHGHDCHLFKMPTTNRAFWQKKIKYNKTNDTLTMKMLQENGWRVFVLWECAVKGKTRKPLPEIIDAISDWLLSDQEYLEIEGAN